MAHEESEQHSQMGEYEPGRNVRVSVGRVRLTLWLLMVVIALSTLTLTELLTGNQHGQPIWLECVMNSTSQEP
jgi:hypothetical protein